MKYNLISQLHSETWKHVVKVQSNLGENVPYEIFVVCCEGSGTKFTSVDSVSHRTDVLTFVPMIVLDMTGRIDREVLEKMGFYQYLEKHIPTTYSQVNEVIANINSEDKVLTFNIKGENILIHLSDISFNILKGIGNFSLVIIDNTIAHIGRVSIDLDKGYPHFPSINKTIYHDGFEESLKGLIPRLGNIPTGRPNKNSFLDTIGSSDYDVYQSTESGESLPFIKHPSLGNRCYSCGRVAEKLSIEHSSPKWLADKYKVKPLTGKIFCSDCNSWFGEHFEKPVSELLQSTPQYLTQEQVALISKWCVKTAFTMSISSGVPVDVNTLPSLKNGILNFDGEVYFDFSVKLREGGFNYGVSRFNKKLSSEKVFLFSFASPLFSFVVINRGNQQFSNPGLKRIYPTIRGCDYERLLNFADNHQRLHEELSEEKTKDYNLPIRDQDKR